MAKLYNRTIPLTRIEIDEFFEKHLPYRQVMLTTHKLITADRPAYQQQLPHEIRDKVNVCGVEASLIVCRMFIEFMGLGIQYKPLKLVEKREYYAAREDGNSYEVKIIDLGGKWVEVSSLESDEKDLLAKMCVMGHRTTAHLTHNAPNGGDWRIIHAGVDLVSKLLNTHLYKIVRGGIIASNVVPIGATGTSGQLE